MLPDIDDLDPTPEGPPDGIAGYDEWKLATPPEYGQRNRLPPVWLHLLPAGSCGRRNWSHCDLPAGHSRDGSLCNWRGRP